MIVNVNPYDTGFEENSHVMRFSALARDVTTNTTATIPKHPTPIARKPSLVSSSSSRQVTLSIPSGVGKKPRHTLLEIVEGVFLSEGGWCLLIQYAFLESAPGEDGREDGLEREGEEDDDDPFITRLFEEIDALRLKVRSLGPYLPSGIVAYMVGTIAIRSRSEMCDCRAGNARGGNEGDGREDERVGGSSRGESTARGSFTCRDFILKLAEMGMGTCRHRRTRQRWIGRSICFIKLESCEVRNSKRKRWCRPR